MTFLKTMLTSTAAITLMTGATFAQATATVDEDATATIGDSASAAVSAAADSVADTAADVTNGDMNFAANTSVDVTTASDVTGTPVLLSTGERIGEIDRVGTMNGDAVLIVGVGGFLGIGEHDVAMTLDELTFDAEQRAFVAAGYTEEQLESLPEYNADRIAFLEDDQPLDANWHSVMAMMHVEAETDLTAMAQNDTAMTPAPANPAMDDTMAADDTMAPAFDYGTNYADIAEMPVNRIIGTRVYSETGEDVGEIDNVGVLDANPVVVVGIGGFLGLGEHDVALNLDRMEYDSERQALVVSGYTEAELKQIPEYDHERIGFLESEAPLSDVWGDKDM